MRPPSKLIKALWKKFKKAHEETMIELVSEAYREGYNTCIEEVNLERRIAKSLRENN